MTAASATYPLSLLDALPIWPGRLAGTGRGGLRRRLYRGPVLHRRPVRGQLLRGYLDAGTLRGMGTRVIAVVGATATGKDRKSTRLNSSHSSISYAVFCPGKT